MSECTTEEISTIITELKNSKASDIPIHVIKKTSHVISPIFLFYVHCTIEYMNEGIFPDELKVGKILNKSNL